MKICLVCEGVSETAQESCASCGVRLIGADEVHFPVRRGEEDAANPLLGALIDGKYRISNVLGKGGMGTVFRAVHEVSLAPVALKVLHPRYAARAEHRAHFLAEARKASSVSNEHTARVLDVGEDVDGTVYIAMEMVEGETLAEWIHDGDGLGAADVLDILYQICLALTAAHDAGLVHRDLTPRNVMGTAREGRPFVKILDFGIARGAPTAAGGGGGESDRALLGFANPPYSAPEHLEGGEVDARADLYSLGVLAYEALSRELPVEGRTARDLAKATIDGAVKPLRAAAGVPSRLVRLIMQLLSRDPLHRPGSAREVMRELQRIGNPRGQVLRALSVISLLITLPAFLLVYNEPREPYVQLQPSETSLVLSVARSGRAQALRSDDLDNLQLQYGGFDPRELVVEAFYVGGEVRVGGDAAAVDPGRGVMTFSRESSPEFASFLSEVAARDKVELVFRVPDRPALAYANVRVDDAPPVVALFARPAGEASLRRSSLVGVTVDDRSALSELALMVSWSDDGVRVERRIELDSPDDIDRRLRESFSGVVACGDVEMYVSAVDEARNSAGLSDVLAFDYMDLAAPGVVAVSGRGPGATVTYDPSEGAWMRVTLDAAEPGMWLEVRHGDQTVRRLRLANRVDHELLFAPLQDDPDAPFADGTYQFRIEDAAENKGAGKTVALSFRSEDPEASLVVEEPEDGAARTAAVLEDLGGRLILADGAPVDCVFRCNPLYTLKAVEVRSQDSVEMRLEASALGAAVPGRIGFGLPGLPDGRYRLEIELAAPTGDVRTLEWSLYVQRDPVELRLPEARERRYLRQLADIGVLTEEAGRLASGRAWRVVPADSRLLRGQIWFGTDSSLVPTRLADRSGWDAPVFRDQPALRGENVVAVELQDLLGRPVTVLAGGQPVVVREMVDGALVHEVARFHYNPDPVTADSEITEIEYGQAARIVLRSPLPFAPEDGLQLLVGAVRSRPLQIEGEAGGARLVFEVPYDLIAQAAQLPALTPAALVDGHEALLPVRLETPVRHYDVALDVRVTRTTLQALQLGQLAADDLDAAVATISMVPLLAPDGEVYRDPVPEGVAMRSSFRPMPVFNVRNVEDLFLQRGEMTRVQYDGLVRSAGGVDLSLDLVEQLVHAADPLGGERLRAMVPVAHVARDGSWERAVRDAGDLPVTGVNFFQAYTAARLAGHLVAGRPDLFRLPMGVELELAALGSGDRRDDGALHGVGRRAAAMTIGDHRSGVAALLTASELGAIGDVATTRQGDPLTGVDFGVREWVLDFPFLPASEGRDVLAEWLIDHRAHVTYAEDLARGPARLADGGASSEAINALQAELSRRGVVRGGFVPLPSAMEQRAADDRLPSSVPGVVRILVLRRDGMGLLSEVDPHLDRVGFRLAGGKVFVQEVRR